MQTKKDLYRFRNEIKPGLWFRLRLLFLGTIVVENSIEVINREIGNVKQSLILTIK